MIAVIGCETARDLLEAFVDGELPTAEQVAVQAHVRWCGTCRARIDDMSLIGWSIRTGVNGGGEMADARDLAVLQAGVLARVRAEREQSLRTRIAECCSDMRLIWPAIGATAAVILCLVGASNVWLMTTEKGPNSVAFMLETAQSGSDRNPMRLEDARSAPRVLHDGLAFDEEPDGERMIMVSTLVTQGGKVGEAEVLDLPGVIPAGGSLAFNDGLDVLKKMSTWQLTPAQSRSGRPVAVRVVYLVVQTTAVKESARRIRAERAHPVEPIKEAPVTVPDGTRSAIDGGSAAA